MRKSHVFVGSSHPELGQSICDRLGVTPGKCTLKKFANGETCIEIGVSVRDEDVYIVQSGSTTVNDHIMEMLILISGCRGGSANKITAVLPAYPYAKQSKMKKHRGAITARMLANLLTMAGADHVITMDLHATQMQGFFTKPVDNLHAGPTLARWIRHNVPDYQTAVIVSKNPGGTKRVTALADALKVNFAMIHTDRRRRMDRPLSHSSSQLGFSKGLDHSYTSTASARNPKQVVNGTIDALTNRGISGTNLTGEFIKARDQGVNGQSELSQESPSSDSQVLSEGSQELSVVEEQLAEVEYLDDEGEKIITHSVQVARVVQGHVVDDDYPSPYETDDVDDSGMMSESIYSISSHHDVPHALGGTVDADGSDDEEEHFDQEKLITLVGDVRDKTAILLDDMIDRTGSFVAAAEHLRINCGAKTVYVVATHGIFSGDGSLQDLEDCPYIDQIVVTNSYPIAASLRERSKKLTIIDISPILAECIRRNHHGESISALFEQLAFI